MIRERSLRVSKEIRVPATVRRAVRCWEMEIRWEEAIFCKIGQSRLERQTSEIGSGQKRWKGNRVVS
jgi:hypothetical protein